VRNFQILIVSAVKIYKQCLQTASASWELRPRPPTGASPLDHTGGLPLLSSSTVRLQYDLVAFNVCDYFAGYRIQKRFRLNASASLVHGRQHRWRKTNKA